MKSAKILLLILLIIFISGPLYRPTSTALGQPSAVGDFKEYLPILYKDLPDANGWPQLGHDSQRTNSTANQVDPPYCYMWKWDEVPIASRAQPVVVNNLLYIGSMNGIFYARNAVSGAPVWQFTSQGPIRNSAGVLGSVVIFSSHDGFTYALNATTGSLLWKSHTGPSATAPLIDRSRGWVMVASTNGALTALNITDGVQQWRYNSGAAILTSPAMSQDSQMVFLGNEDIYAIAVNAANGAELWRTRLQGQSQSDRYPVVAGNNVIFRSQPVYNFHLLLHEGDDVMDQAGTLLADWSADWANVRGQILSYLSSQPAKQTFFVLNTADGKPVGTAPVLYTFGSNEIPAPPVVRNGNVYVDYRARHGIQTDSHTIHVTTRYDAELGQFDLTTLDITGLHSNQWLSGQPEFRMTSDEPSMLTMGGDILWVDNWERAGGLNVKTGQLVPIGIVSAYWPECAGSCTPGGINPFFPLYSNTSPYPFPSPRVTEGVTRGGIVIADGMLYWHVVEGGLAGIGHQVSSSCPTPQIWASSPVYAPITPTTTGSPSLRSLSDYVTLDLTAPASNPNPDLLEELLQEVNATVETNAHLMPYYLERGVTNSNLWPYNTTNPPGPPKVNYINTGNVFWHDPGELLYSLAMAYPYLGSALQAKVKSYMAGEMTRYPPLSPLPWTSSPAPAWLSKGTPREGYEVPFRTLLNNWPPPAPNFSVLYGLWLWLKNTGDWSYAQNHWSQIQNLFNSSKGSTLYYADIAGAIGFARMADHFGYATDFQAGVQAAVAGMQAGLSFDNFRQRAEGQYPGPWDAPSGWYAPVFYGLTPELGLYLKEQLGGAAENYILGKENADGLRWWYITRVGQHAETGETAFILPTAAWSHFLAHAYVISNKQSELIQWIDRPWGRGDLYSIQKLVAAIQAQP